MCNVSDNSPAGAGVDADLVIYVSTRDRAECGSTLAAAAACAFDPETNRPLAGNLIFCKIDPSVFDKDLATAVHEVLHVLVRCPAHTHHVPVRSFRARLADRELNRAGAQHTRTNAWLVVSGGRGCVQGMDATMFSSGQFYIDENGVELSKEDVLAEYSEGGRAVTAVVTPSVVAAARAQLGCNSLRGAELEDDGGLGTAGSHWEQRVFEGAPLCAVFCHAACNCTCQPHAATAISSAIKCWNT